ncbi:MAG: DUF4406 domain-containing protein [Firmicutes bacterium]|nr:DUF4406 domain-containing protein [Bacillota bacterium]
MPYDRLLADWLSVCAAADPTRPETLAALAAVEAAATQAFRDWRPPPAGDRPPLAPGARVYIAGPMSGLPGYHYPAFDAAAMALARAGHRPVNPADTGLRPGWERADYLRHSLGRLLREADGIACLPGWRRSRRARLEVRCARELGLPVAPLSAWLHAAEPAPVRG